MWPLHHNLPHWSYETSLFIADALRQPLIQTDTCNYHKLHFKIGFLVILEIFTERTKNRIGARNPNANREF
jgi:hypothetical protein